MEIKQVRPSLSPSMDIQVSSNFERLLFDLCERDGSLTNETIENFRANGYFEIETELIAKRANIFSALSVDDETTLARIKKTHKDTGEIIDPHSAVGLEAAHQIRSSGSVSPEIPIISLACAHPAKFPDAVNKATGSYPALPAQLDDLLEKKEHTVVLPNDFDAISNYIADNTNV